MRLQDKHEPKRMHHRRRMETTPTRGYLMRSRLTLSGPRFNAIETHHTYLSNQFGELQTSYQNLSHEVAQVHQYATNLNHRMDQWEQSSVSHLATLRELDA